jgi:ribosomal protein S18 acetylase RimI-like enzyme
MDFPNDTGVRIRQALPRDLPAVQRIGRETYLDHFAGYWSAEGLQRFLQRDFSTEALEESLASAQQAWFLVETASAGVVGYARINWNRTEPHSGLPGAELQKIYFLATAAGQGFGAKLLDHLMRTATDRDERRIWLNVLKDNIGAQRFYAKFRFETTGEMPFRTDLGDEIGMLVMMRQLTSNS